MLTARAPIANVGPDRTLPYVGPCPGLNDCAYLSWNSSSCTPVRPRPNPLYWPLLKFARPGEDCAVMGEHADRQGSSGCQLTAYSFPWPLLPALALTEFCVPTPGSCHDTGTCSWPPQPSVLTLSAIPALVPSCWTCRHHSGPQQLLEPPQTPCSPHQGHAAGDSGRSSDQS